MTVGIKSQLVKNILSAVTIAVLGFILLNLTFLIDFLFQSLIIGFLHLFTPVDLIMTVNWFPPLLHGLFVMVIGIISLFIFRLNIGPLYKAIYMTIPCAVILVTIGMFLYRWPVAAYFLGGLFSICVLYYLYRTKQPWFYFYTVILISLTLLIVGLLGVEI